MITDMDKRLKEAFDRAAEEIEREAAGEEARREREEMRRAGVYQDLTTLAHQDIEEMIQRLMRK